MTAFPSVAVIGFGNMGQAISAGLLEASGFPPERIRPFDPSPVMGARAEALGIACAGSSVEAVRGAEVVLICVKPYMVADVLEGLRDAGALDHGPLVISIAAGVKLAAMEACVPQATPVVRAMPNTACAVRQGMVVLSPGQAATREHLDRARALFEPIARVMDLEEKHMDAVTALSGSGPAFIYTVLEALATGGIQCGLPAQVAQELAAQMTLGAATMALQSGKHTGVLRDEVCTPAGTTIAGLMVLEDGRLRATLARGVEEAARVAKGLGK